MNSVTAIILCYNESANIEHCLKSIHRKYPIFVVDSGSTDDTVEICKRYTTNIYQHSYTNHANQWQWALDELPIESEWVLTLDADYVLSDELVSDINDAVIQAPAQLDGIYLRHSYTFAGKQIRFGGTKSFKLCLVKKSRAHVEASDLVDFRFYVDGETTKIDTPISEYNRYDDDVSTWLKKQDKFSLRLAMEEELRRKQLLDWQGMPRFFGNADERIMWLRDKWMRMPLFLRPFVYFIYRYILMLGFLDGRAGFLYHFLQGWWLRLIVDWKTWQIRKHQFSSAELESLKQHILETRDGSVDGVISHWTR